MTIAAKRPVIAFDRVGGHAVRSVIASNEPERHRGKALADLESALPSADAFDGTGCRIEHVATTPDFHAGKPVPVGVVVDILGGMMPHMIGNDIGCGMRMIALEGIGESDLVPSLEGALRHVHFQGGRDIALTGRDRHAVLREGIPGLLESLGGGVRKGLLASLDMAGQWRDAGRNADDGFFRSDGIDVDFEDFAAIDDTHRRDAILGTIGGGNHFVEFGVVEKVEDGQFAGVAGLRPGTVVLTVHSGSLDFGQRVGTAIKDRLRQRKGKTDQRILSADRDGELAQRYATGLANAANVAFVNRYLIGLASIEAVRRTLGREIGHHLVYDVPHNTIWADGGTWRHRKGACPARGPGQIKGSPYEWLGEPVILPGSMGDGIWLLKGLGAEDGLESAAHGAGRRLSRQESRSEAVVPARLRVVGPVDLSAPQIRGRPDILREVEGRLKEEAPDAYRPIESVVDPMVEAGLVARVAKIRPVLTVKG